MDLNGVEAHVLAGWQVHGLFQKYKKFKVSKAAVKTSFLWFTAVLVIDFLKNAQSISFCNRLCSFRNDIMLEIPCIMVGNAVYYI